MRDWTVVISNGVHFVFSSMDGYIGSALDKKDDSCVKFTSRCTAAELPYPFWYHGIRRNVYINDYTELLLELT